MPNDNLLYLLVADQELNVELDKRTVRRFAPTVVEPKGLAELGSTLFKEGTIVLFIAEGEHSKAVEQLLKSAASGDRKAVDAAEERLRHAEQVGLARVGRKPVFEAQHLVEVSYGTEKLARGVAPSMVGGVAVAVAVWNGGRLDHAKFGVADHLTHAGVRPVSVHAVLVHPRLSELERAVLAAVPDDLDDLHLKGPSLGWTAVARDGVHVPLDHQGPVFGQEQAQQQDVNTDVAQIQQQQQDDTAVQQQQEEIAHANTNNDQVQQQENRLQTVRQQQQREQVLNTWQAEAQAQQDYATHQQYQLNLHQGATNQHQEQQHSGESSWLDDRQGVAWNSFDRDEYLNTIQSTDFDALDATQSAQALLRIRRQLLRRGMA